MSTVVKAKDILKLGQVQVDLAEPPGPCMVKSDESYLFIFGGPIIPIELMRWMIQLIFIKKLQSIWK